MLLYHMQSSCAGVTPEYGRIGVRPPMLLNFSRLLACFAGFCLTRTSYLSVRGFSRIFAAQHWIVVS